jgi:hypothetical protein
MGFDGFKDDSETLANIKGYLSTIAAEMIELVYTVKQLVEVLSLTSDSEPDSDQ